MVSNRDVGQWLSDLLPQSLPTLNGLMDAARRVRSDQMAVRSNAPLLSKAAPSSLDEVTRPFDLVRRRTKDIRASADVVAAPISQVG